jgi:hypothetical protein
MERDTMSTQLKPSVYIAMPCGDSVKTKAHPKYMKKKLHIYPHHEEWAIKNGYLENDTLNSKNTISFEDGAER